MMVVLLFEAVNYMVGNKLYPTTVPQCTGYPSPN